MPLKKNFEAIYKYAVGHVEVLLLVCGVVLVFALTFTALFDSGAIWLVRLVCGGLLVCGFLPYMLRFWLKLVSRIAKGERNERALGLSP